MLTRFAEGEVQTLGLMIISALLGAGLGFWASRLR